MSFWTTMAISRQATTALTRLCLSICHATVMRDSQNLVLILIIWRCRVCLTSLMLTCTPVVSIKTSCRTAVLTSADTKMCNSQLNFLSWAETSFLTTASVSRPFKCRSSSTSQFSRTACILNDQQTLTDLTNPDIDQHRINAIWAVRATSLYRSQSDSSLSSRQVL